MITIIAFHWMSRKASLILALVWPAIVVCGCHSSRPAPQPSIEFTQLPHAGAGGPDQVELIGGRVTGAQSGQKIVLYAHSGVWWVQPTKAHPFTVIQPDSSWKNTTHLGTDYAALLVDGNYDPASRVVSVPTVGKGVLAVAASHGQPGAPIVSKVIHFSGYDWTVRSASSDRGGEANTYDPSNVWTDEHGYLHLYMGPRNGRWTCAEVNLNRSLGFGTYRFVVRDIAHLSPSAVVGLFTWDDIRSEDLRNELDIELSRWDDPASWNAQYVVQPFYVSENVSRFLAPPGTLTYTLRWEPGSANFKTVRASGEGISTHPVSEHTFRSGVPSPASETVHMDLYDFHHSRHSATQPVEVVIERFEYVP